MAAVLSATATGSSGLQGASTPGRYVPGMPNPYFPKHKYHGIPLNRNIRPISECMVREYVGPDGKPRRGVDVHILTAEHLWWTFQKEAEDIISENGQIIEDPRTRNRRINAAYAKLWLADQRFQWAGLAAFASKQVGCGLLHARNVVIKRTQELQQVAHWAGNNTEAAAVSAIPMMTRNGSDYMYERLGFGNMHLFLDIYPLHRFYMERGLKELLLCLPKRRDIGKRVHWEVDATVLPFGFPFREIGEGFQRIESGGIVRSVQSLARHEQINILQALLYNDRMMQLALDANQFNWATGFPTGDYAEIELTLSAQCKAKIGLTTLFSKKWNAKLYEVEQRMVFVNRAAGQFEQLLRSPQRPLVEQSIKEIHAGGGVK